MNFAAILAGGKGTRMGNQDKPKQFLDLAGKPILIHSVEKFLVMPEFEKVIVLCPESWVEKTKDLIGRQCALAEKCAVIAGGSDRNDTIAKAIAFIEQNFGLDEETVLMTHDAVRPFVTYRIIKENLEAVRSHDACDTVIPCTDTIVESQDGATLQNIPDRSVLYQGQTPQTFKVATLKRIQGSLSAEEKGHLTDACKICSMKGVPCALVQGEPFNIKITYPSDLKMASALLGCE